MAHHSLPLQAVPGMAGSGRPATRSRPAREWVPLVLDALAPDADPQGFLVRRARRDAEESDVASGRRQLLRVLDAFSDPCPSVEERLCALLEWAGFLEARALLPEAARVLDLALRIQPGDPEAAMGRARVARKAGDRPRARALYACVQEASPSGSTLSRLADVGHALLSPDPESALTQVLAAVRRTGDDEAAAVAQESRARARRARGDVSGALRDYVLAAVRYRDPLDRGRLGQEMADLLVGVGDVLGARTVLLRVLAWAHPTQHPALLARLQGLSLTLGDELGARRWAAASPPALVTLGISRRRCARPEESRAPRLERWADRLGGPGPEWVVRAGASRPG